MRIKEFTYSQYDTTPAEWKITKLEFDKINLIVGKNATGKTRTLNVIYGLARMLSETKNLNYTSGNYLIDFINEHEYHYELGYTDKIIINEQLVIDGDNYISRNEDGEGEIFYMDEKTKLKFRNPSDTITASTRRDSLQHSFLSPLHEWADSVIYYKFGEKMGQNTFLTDDINNVSEFNYKNTEKVVNAFIVGMNKFPQQFENVIIQDMAQAGYDIEDIGLDYPEGLEFSSPFSSQSIQGLYVKEKDLRIPTQQLQMSQGMFRALSLIIQINYFHFLNLTGTILIDDIGEGLDFDRSSSLIEIITEKAEKSNFQLIMATNDRFIMNKVPVKYWIILHREGGNLQAYDYRNSKEVFDKFQMTGLNNFDLFSSDYYLTSFRK